MENLCGKYSADADLKICEHFNTFEKSKLERNRRKI